MKQLQVAIDAALDEALERAALAENTSKAELLRRYARERILTPPPLERDPLLQMAGADDFEPQPIDEVVYR